MTKYQEYRADADKWRWLMDFHRLPHIRVSTLETKDGLVTASRNEDGTVTLRMRPDTAKL